MDGAVTMAMAMMVKEEAEEDQETSARELVYKSSTVLCSSESIHSIQSQEYFHSC